MAWGQAEVTGLFTRAGRASAAARELHRAAKLQIVERLVQRRHQVDRAGTAAEGMGRPGSGRAGRCLGKRLPRSESAPRLARHALVEWLDLALSGDEMQRAKLAVSELVTNAITHGRGEVTIEADVNRNRLRVEVVDEGTGFAYRVPNVPIDQLSRRGLAIVDAITSRWGIREDTSCVWFELDVEGDRAKHQA